MQDPKKSPSGHVSTIGKKLVKQQYLPHMSPQYGELRPTSGWDQFVSLEQPYEFQWVSRYGSVTAQYSSSGRQPNFAALNRGCHRYSAGRPSRWALAHILVSIWPRLSVIWQVVLAVLLKLWPRPFQKYVRCCVYWYFYSFAVGQDPVFASVPMRRLQELWRESWPAESSPSRRRCWSPCPAASRRRDQARRSTCWSAGPTSAASVWRRTVWTFALHFYCPLHVLTHLLEQVCTRNCLYLRFVSVFHLTYHNSIVSSGLEIS